MSYHIVRPRCAKGSGHVVPVAAVLVIRHNEQSAVPLRSVPHHDETDELHVPHTNHPQAHAYLGSVAKGLVDLLEEVLTCPQSTGVSQLRS